MPNSFRRKPAFAGLLGLALFSASVLSHAQEATPLSSVERLVTRIDLSVQAVGEFTGSSSGTNYLQQTVSLIPSETVGYGATLRYIRKPLLGFEFNYNLIRYTNNFALSASSNPSLCGTASCGVPAASYGVQANAKEYSGGYIAHTRRDYFGVKPFAGVGFGTIQFTPTVNGGYHLPRQYRAAYSYKIGAETYLLGDHLGARVDFRQVIHNAPDFLTDYLTIHRHTITSEPEIGLFLRF
jgi:hypothetical protein